MADEKSGGKKSRKAPDSRRENANALIGNRLRGYYDSIVDEGTPDHILDLLQRLDEAERSLNEK